MLSSPSTALMALSANEWNAIFQGLLAMGAVLAAGWATFTFHKSKRAEAARWMVQLFRDFYRDEQISLARELLEYDFDLVAAPLLELRVLDRHVVLSAEERARLRDLDLVLNFLEQLLYLEHEGHLRRHDREVFFEYWFDQLAVPERPALRRYLRNCGYERCSEFLRLGSDELFVAYGSLMTGEGGDEEEAARKFLESLGPCRVEGTLYSRGEFPALVRSPGVVEAELFRVVDKQAFRALDRLEHYDATRRDDSLYRRRCVRLLQPAADAWVYFWNEPVDGLEAVQGGSWKSFLERG